MKTMVSSLVILLIMLTACTKREQSSVNMDQLYAWCIVPFDAKHRNPAERIAMLKEMGFVQYAYDWRTEHLDEMQEEFRLAAENGVKVMAAWMWIDPLNDAPGRLSADNERMLENLRQAGLQTTLWLSFHPDYFKDLPVSSVLQAAVEMVGYVAERARWLNCRLALYNHGDWFGRPANQIRIIKALPEYDIGLVFNFHHAHDVLDEFDESLPQMLPFLRAVSLNGMKRGGPKILPLGQGDLEKDMIGKLREAGYKGPFGLLGHVEEEDVAVVLRRNLDGWQKLGMADREDGGNKEQ